VRGVVASFDEPVGIGVVTGEDGRDYPFHCTQIADGTRTIPSGAEVTFEVIAGHQGRWEAAEIATA
jgi:CspA family cold shock protein